MAIEDIFIQGAVLAKEVVAVLVDEVANGIGEMAIAAPSAEGIAVDKNIEGLPEFDCAATEPANIRTTPITYTTCLIAYLPQETPPRAPII